MIPLNPPRLAIARKLLAQFRAAGKPPPTRAAPGAAKSPPPKPVDLQRSPVGWPITRDALVAELDQRLHGSLPDQRNTSYCGCAAFLVCLLVDRPDLYVAYAIALWSGDDYTFRALRRSLEVKAAAGTIKNAAAIEARKFRANFVSALDWMTMASLSGASHGGAPRAADDGSGLMSEWNAITWPAMVKKWFGAVGCAPQLDSVGLGAFNASAEDLLDLLAQWDNHWLVMEIDASLLEGGSASISNRHWVVVNAVYRPTVQPDGSKTRQSPAAFRDSVRAKGIQPVLGDETGMAGVEIYEAQMEAGSVDMEVVSWADDTHRFLKPTLAHIASLFYGGYAFPRIR